jgi:ABC-type transport system involved in cytochrome bd biosynthesis fused ATPase/permease subunit
MSSNIHKSFFSLLKIGLGSKPIRFFVDPILLSYIILDSLLGYMSITFVNSIIQDLTINKSNFNIFKLIIILFSPLYHNLLNIFYNNYFLKKKLFVINNILDYIKGLIIEAPNEFHEKFSLSEKYECFTSSLWGYDHVVHLIINLLSSLIKIITVSITISYSDYTIGLLLLLSNAIILYVLPKINNYIDKLKINISYKELYSTAYYDTVIMEENRTNPLVKNLVDENLNKSLSQIVTKYSNKSNYYELSNTFTTVFKNLILALVFGIVYYNDKLNYILVLFINQSIIFGFADLYADFKKTENSNSKNMEELTAMLEFLDQYYLKNKINVVSSDYSKINLDKLILENLNYELSNKDKIFKKLKSNKIEFNFNTTKNIILINGKTGSGKSLFTKILSGFTDNNYKLMNNSENIYGFDKLMNNRIFINQKISEDYSYNGNVSMKLKLLYPLVNNIDDLMDYLKNFNIEHKILEKDLDSKFCDKLSGGERQRVVLSSMIWKIMKTNPQYIIIDEPEKGIDEETMIKIMDYIIKKYKGLIFLITHNETIKKKYNNIIQSTLLYNFIDDEEIDTTIYQIMSK